MNMLSQFSKRTTMATAMAIALGGTAALQTAAAAPHTFAWDGLFTMLTSVGAPLANSSEPYTSDPTWNYGLRTQISGTFTYDPDTGLGTMTVAPFEFFDGSSPAVAGNITLEAIGDGFGDPNGTLLLGNMLFDWSGNNGIPVTIVWDAAGMLNALGAISVNDTITAVGAPPASDQVKNGNIPIGPAPVATTGWDTTTINCTPGGGTTGECMGVAVSGDLPLLEGVLHAQTWPNQGEKIGGSPMAAGPFEGFNANFDLTSMTLTSDGSVSFTPPAPVTDNTVPQDPLPATWTINIGTPSNVSPGDAAIDYCIGTNAACIGADGPWIPDNAPNNEVEISITQTINTATITWRARDAGAGVALGTQIVTAGVADTLPPVFDNLPTDVIVSVESTAVPVTIASASDPAITATDAVEPNVTIQWSLDGLNWNSYNPAQDTVVSTGLGPDANTVYWRATDARNNSVIYEQTVTLVLAAGIVGEPCVVDPDLLNASIGSRLLEGTFTMRTKLGTQVAPPDDAVFGSVDTAVVCPDELCTDSGMQLESPTPFFDLLWTTSAIRLFDQPGTYTFETCLADGSTLCELNNTPLTMEVGPGQLGGHMLFEWGTSRNIDVVVVWDYSCGGSELVTTDPDGDGIIGTKMVDGPFKDFNAAFDLRTQSGEPPITTGGFAVSLPTVKNPVPNTSPIALQPGEIGTILGGVTITASALFDTYGAASDSSVVESCVGGCFDFEVSGRDPGETIQVVLPLSEPVPWYAVYRKYDATTNSWRNFAVIGPDNVMTAALDENGRCPEPGAGDYSANVSGIMANMLRPGDQCVQLTITDGGPNDTNPADGVIADPGGVGLTSGPPAPKAPTTGSSGCTLAADGTTPGQRFDLWLLAGLLGWLGLRRKQAS